jgi:hypothetical protein
MIDLTREFFIQERIPEDLNVDSMLEELGWEMMQLMRGIEVEALDLDTEGGWVRVRVSGADEGAAENLIYRTYGKLKRAEEAKVGESLKGFITDLGEVGYGIYFKAFLGEKDCLYPLYEMRKQLVDNMKLSTRTIANIYGFMNDVSMEINVTKIDEKGIYVSLSPRQVRMIRDMIKMGREILLVVRATPKQVKRALNRTGHYRDVSMVRKSFLSHMLICKRKTQAKGLIPRLGPYLPGAKFSTISQDKFRKLTEVNFLNHSTQ